MIGDVEVDNLKAVMDVSFSILTNEVDLSDMGDGQLWLDNQSVMTGLSSTVNKLASAISGISNALAGQTRARARLNAIASYDQSNELFKASNSYSEEAPAPR